MKSDRTYLHELRLCGTERATCLFSMTIMVCYHSFQEVQPYIAITQEKIDTSGNNVSQS